MVEQDPSKVRILEAMYIQETLRKHIQLLERLQDHMLVIKIGMVQYILQLGQKIGRRIIISRGVAIQLLIQKHTQKHTMV